MENYESAIEEIKTATNHIVKAMSILKDGEEIEHRLDIVIGELQDILYKIRTDKMDVDEMIEDIIADQERALDDYLSSLE